MIYIIVITIIYIMRSDFLTDNLQDTSGEIRGGTFLLGTFYAWGVIQVFTHLAALHHCSSACLYLICRDMIEEIRTISNDVSEIVVQKK